VPALPVQHLTPFAAVAADPQDPHVSTGIVQRTQTSIATGSLTFPPFFWVLCRQ
jgi:hypothetical protein